MSRTEVIDLVSSDDEIVVSSDDEIVVFDSSTSRAQSKRERKSEVLPGKRYKKNWKEGEGTMGPSSLRRVRCAAGGGTRTGRPVGR